MRDRTGRTGQVARVTREGLGIASLLLVAFLLRLPGVWQNLPFVFHWDEPTLVNLAVWIFTDGSLNPRFFAYPGAMYYALAALIGVTLLFGTIFGAFTGFSEGIRRLAAGTYPRPPDGAIIYRLPTRGVPLLYVLGRLLSAVLGTLSVWWSFRLGERLGGRRVAWLAAALLALNALHAANSTLVTTDVACGALLTWFLLELFGRASARRTGIALGLAIAVKYTAGIGFYLWPLGLLIPATDEPRRQWNRRWWSILPWALGAFLLTNPYVLLTPRAFFQGFLAEVVHMRAGTAHFGEGIALGPTGLAVVAQTLWRDFGGLPLAGLFAAFAFGLRRRSDGAARPVLLLGSWCIVYLVQLATWKTAYPRYLLPIWPALAVLAAAGWESLLDLIRPRLGRRSASAATAPILLALCVVPGLLPLTRSVRSRLERDPRVELSRVIERQLPPTETIAVETGGPWIDANERQVTKVDLLGRAKPEAWRARGVRYLIATGRERYLPGGSPDSLFANRRRLDEVARPIWKRGPYVLFDLGEGQDPFNQARRALEAGRPEQAQATLEELCRREPGNAPALMLLGDARLARRDTSSAVDAYLQASEVDAKDPIPYLALGAIALNARQWDSAVAAFTRARELSPRDPVPVNNLATALLYRAEQAMGRGEREAAIRDLNDAARLAQLAVSITPEDARFRQLEAKTRELSKRWGIPLTPVP